MTGSFGESIIMQCQLCQNPHHDSPKKCFIQDRQTGAYAEKVCPLCMCLDCVQKYDDPIRARVRPLMMGQTFQSQYNLTVEENIKGQAPRTRNIQHNAPGPLNLPEVLKQIGGILGVGLQPASGQPRHNVGYACSCGKNAISKCIGCEKPLCMKCLKAHECDE
jgi:hypothetical protein